MILLVKWKPHGTKGVKETQSALGPRSPRHLFSRFEKGSPQPEIKGHLEIRFNFRSVFLNFQLFTEKPVFECSSYEIFFIINHLVKTVWIASLLCAN